MNNGIWNVAIQKEMGVNPNVGLFDNNIVSLTCYIKGIQMKLALPNHVLGCIFISDFSIISVELG